MGKRTKKLLSLLTAAALSASSFSALVISANAEDATVNITPTDLTYINAGSPDNNFSEAGVVYANQSQISGGKFTDMLSAYGGTDIALMQFDVSQYAGRIVSAKLSFTATCTTADKNSQVKVATTDTGWKADEVTWNTMPDNCASLMDAGYAGGTGATFNLDVTDNVRSDEDGILSYALYTATGRQQAITAVSMDIVASDDVIEEATVTVNNVADGKTIKTYTVDGLMAGDSYTANRAQTGYKFVDDTYYFVKDDATTTIDSLVGGENVLNIEFAASDEDIVVYEDFANVSDIWGFTAGQSNSVTLGTNGLNLTQFNKTSGDPNEYGYYYSDVKEFDSTVSEMTTLDIEYQWTSTVEGGKNRKNAFELRDSENNVILGMISQAAKGSSDTMPAGVTYQVGAKATDDSTNIASSGWATGNSGVYTVNLHLDFTGEKGKVSGTIKGGVANADITIDETEIDAANFAKIVASDIYSLAPQTLNNFKITGEAAPEVTEAPATEAPATDAPDVTDAPATDAPDVTDAPATEAPDVTEAPAPPIAEGTDSFDEDMVVEKGTNSYEEGSLKGWFTNFGGDDENSLAVKDGKITSYVSATKNNTYFGKHVTTVAGAADKRFKVTFDYTSTTGTATSNDASEIALLSYDDNDVTWTQAYTNGLGIAYVVSALGITNTEATYEVTIEVDNVARRAIITTEEKDNGEGIALAAAPTVTVYEFTEKVTNVNTVYFRTGRQKTDTIDNFTVAELDEAPVVPTAAPTEAPTPTPSPAPATEAPTASPSPAPVTPSPIPVYKVTFNGVGDVDTVDGKVPADKIPAAPSKKVYTLAEGVTAATIIKVTYNEDGTLESISATAAEITGGTIDVPADADTVRYLLWDNLTGMKPVSTGEETKTAKWIVDGEGWELTADVVITKDITVTAVYDSTPAPAPTPAPTPTPSPEPTPTPTAPPTEDPNTTVYINEPFDYDNGEIIRSAGNDVENAPDPVTKGDIVYTAGRRANGAINCYASISDGKLYISSPGESTNSRGIGFSFAASAGVPTVDALADGEVLEMSFDIAATQTFTVTGYGEITTADLNGGTKVRLILDKSANKQYLIVLNGEDKVVNSKIADLAATTFTGMTFYHGAGTHTIDNLKVVKKAVDTGILNITTEPETTISIGAATFTTNAEGALTIAVPNGTYEITASKSGYEHTEGMGDNDVKTVTVNSNTQSVEFTLAPMNYMKNPHEELTVVEGGQTFIAAPKEDAASTTAAYTVNVVDQYGVAMTEDEYTLDWAIYPAGSDEADPSVTIKDGIVSISQAFSAGDDQVKAYDVIATVTANNEGLRSVKVTKTLYIGNMDIIYYEPIAWNVANGTRNASVNLASSVSLPEMSSVKLNMQMNYTEGNSNFAIITSGGKFVGLQLVGDTLTAWTGWGGNSNMNQSGDVGQFTNSKVLLEGYDKSAIDVTFVIDGENKSISVSTGSSTVSLPFVANAGTFTGFQMGQYRTYGGVAVNSVTIQEPDTNYLSINGDADFAKVSGQTIEKQYALGQSVIVPDEEFIWAIEGDVRGITIDNTGKLTVNDDAEAGIYTITAVSNVNPDKKAELKVTIGDFETFTNENVEISGPRAYVVGDTTGGTYKVEKAVDSFGDDVASLLPTAKWSSSNTAVAEITEDGVLTVKGEGTTTITATINNGGKESTLTVDVTVATYSITSNTVGSTVDISSLIKSDAITGYLVTVADANKNKLAQATVQANGNTVAVPTYSGTAASVEVAPVFEYAIGDPAKLGTLGGGYEIAIPADSYNFTVKDTGARTDVYVNKQMIVNNILQGGSAVNTFTVNDVVVNEGVANITKDDEAGAPNITLTITKSPSNVNRVKKVYVLGDSLACIYYNGASGPDSNWQTGWGQLLDKYLTDDVEIINLANSGSTANRLVGTAFTQIAASAKTGDIVLIESGYNDRTYDSKEIMTAALNTMIDGTKANGAIPVLVSPNASAHTYGASVSWTGVMEEVAENTQTAYIDLSQASYNYYETRFGGNKDAFRSVYAVSDGLHLTYNAAQCWAAVVACGLINLDMGEIVKADATYTFTDSVGDVTVGPNQSVITSLFN